jgi:hypothetical protein
MDRTDLVLILKDVATQTKRNRLDPAVVGKVEEKCGLGVRVELHGIFPAGWIRKHVQSTVGPDVLGHRREVLLPGLKQRPVVRHQFDAATEDLGFDLVFYPGRTTLGKLLFFFRGDQDDRISHKTTSEMMIFTLDYPVCRHRMFSVGIKWDQLLI